MANILIADDHPLILLGTQSFLMEKGYRVVAACDNGIETYNQIVAKNPDIALLDINMPGLSGLEVIEKVRSTHSKNNTKFVLLTLQNEWAIFNYAKSLGVMGFLLKEFVTQELDNCLQCVLEGKPYFSNTLMGALHTGDNQLASGNVHRDIKSSFPINLLSFAEKKILTLIAEQKSSKEIAQLLFITEKTVETHRSHIIKKLGIPSGKNALLKWAIENRHNSF